MVYEEINRTTIAYVRELRLLVKQAEKARQKAVRVRHGKGDAETSRAYAADALVWAARAKAALERAMLAVDDAVTETKDALAFLREVVDGAELESRERTVIRDRFFADPPASLETVGRHLGITRERVRQIELRAREKIVDALTRR